MNEELWFILACIVGIVVWVVLDWDVFMSSIIEDYEQEDI